MAVSIIIKALNEKARIGAAIESALAALATGTSTTIPLSSTASAI